LEEFGTVLVLAYTHNDYRELVAELVSCMKFSMAELSDVSDCQPFTTSSQDVCRALAVVMVFMMLSTVSSWSPDVTR